VEGPAERQPDLLLAVPGAHERGALVGEQGEGPGQRGGRAGELEEQGHAAGREGGRKLLRGGRGDAQRPGQLPSPVQRVGGQDDGAGPLQQQGGDDADRAEPQDDDGVVGHLTRVQAQLQSGLDQREQGGRPGVGAGRERDDVGLGGDEPVLVRVEGEDQRSRRHRAGGPLDGSDAAVAVRERIAEAAAERPDALVQGEVGVELAAVAEQLGAGADARTQRPDEHLAGAGLGDVDGRQLHAARGEEHQSASQHPSSPPDASDRF
jgi:hypothetical protein